MIVECPRCGVRYPLDNSKMGHQGVSLRCGSCQLVWRQKPHAVDHCLVVAEPKKKHSKSFLPIVCIIITLFVIFKSSPLVQELTCSFFYRRTSVIEIPKFSFDYKKETQSFLCQGSIMNASHKEIKSPYFFLYFLSPYNYNFYEKKIYPFTGLTLMPGQTHSFSFQIKAPRKEFTFVSIGM